MEETEHDDWVYQRAAALMNEQVRGFKWTGKEVLHLGSASVKALAALIFKHEPPPVDPLLIEAMAFTKSRGWNGDEPL